MHLAVLLLLAQFPFPGPGPRGTGTAPGGTCGSTYAHCASITVSAAKVGTGGVSSFPILIKGTQANLATVANSGQVIHTVTQPAGASITVPADFTLSSASNCGSPIAFEWESYTATSGAAILWGLAPSLSSSTGGTLYACWGAASVTTYQGNVAGVWGAYSAVYHESTPGGTLNANDSTSNALNPAGSTATAGTGQIDGGAAFSTQFIGINNAVGLQGTATLTVSCWVNVSANSGTQEFIAKPNNYFIREDTGLFDFAWFDGSNVNHTPATAPTAGVFHHVVGVANSNAIIALYVDGVVSGTPTVWFAGSRDITQAVVLGATGGGGEALTGTLDEARISNTFAASQAWVTTEFNSQSSPATFYTWLQIA